MRASTVSFVVGLAITVSAAPAQAAWQNYVSHTLGLSFEAPGTITAEIGDSPRGPIVGTKEESVFKSTENNIDYKVEVINLRQAQEMSETILLEALNMFQGTKPVLTDTFGRVGAGKDMVYGRKTTIDLGAMRGHSTSAFYFTNGYLYHLTATVKPNGNYASPDVARFIDSVSFDAGHAKPGAKELELPE